MKIGRAPRTFQELIFALQRYWSEHGCVILQPYDMEVGAGTFHTATFPVSYTHLDVYKRQRSLRCGRRVLQLYRRRHGGGEIHVHGAQALEDAQVDALLRIRIGRVCLLYTSRCV